MCDKLDSSAADNCIAVVQHRGTKEIMWIVSHTNQYIESIDSENEMVYFDYSTHKSLRVDFPFSLD